MTKQLRIIVISHQSSVITALILLLQRPCNLASFTLTTSHPAICLLPRMTIEDILKARALLSTQTTDRAPAAAAARARGAAPPLLRTRTWAPEQVKFRNLTWYGWMQSNLTWYGWMQVWMDE